MEIKKEKESYMEGGRERERRARERKKERRR